MEEIIKLLKHEHLHHSTEKIIHQLDFFDAVEIIHHTEKHQHNRNYKIKLRDREAENLPFFDEASSGKKQIGQDIF